VFILERMALHRTDLEHAQIALLIRLEGILDEHDDLRMCMFDPLQHAGIDQCFGRLQACIKTDAFGNSPHDLIAPIKGMQRDIALAASA